jgi:hypothetical protein
MSTDSRKSSKIYFSYKQLGANTPSTTCFFEGNGEMDLPEAEILYELDNGKLGAGEDGTTGELQTAWTPFTYTCDRMSEIAYFMSYFQGKSYSVVNIGALEKHELFHLGINDRTLPFFTFEYSPDGLGINIVISDCIVNEFSITLSGESSGIIEATFSGFGNRHRIVGNEIALNATGTMSSGAFEFSSEPLINYRCCRLWAANSANHLKAGSVDFSGEDLGAGLINLTTLSDSITFGGNNGFVAEEMTRAGGCGIINDHQRGERTLSLEMTLRKDNDVIDIDDLIIDNTKKAVELEFNGPYISGTDPYAIQWLWPVVQFFGGQEDSDIAKTIGCDIFEDSTGSAFECFVQSQVSESYNAEPILEFQKVIDVPGSGLEWNLKINDGDADIVYQRVI